MYNFLEQQDFEDWLALIPLKLQNLARRLEDQVFFRKPIIKSPISPICPMMSITTMIHRKNSKFIEESIEKVLRRQ